jgi:hypothetical protein
MASFTESQRTALHRISSAPAALNVASAQGKIFGLTRYNLASPMFFIALATPPMLPGCVVPTRTIRIFENKSDPIGKSSDFIRFLVFLTVHK